MNIPQNNQFNYNQSQPIGYTPGNNVPNNNYNQPQPIGYIQGNNIPNNN